MTKLFAHDEREDSDNEVWPGKHDKEAFKVIVELKEYEDIVEEELSKNLRDSDKSNTKDESFQRKNKNIVNEFPVETYTLTTKANVNEQHNVKGEQKKENKISRIYLFISPLLLTLTPTILLMIACTRKYKNRQKMMQVSGFQFFFFFLYLLIKGLAINIFFLSGSNLT